MFRKMPFVLLALLLLVGFCNPWIPITCKSILYGISLSLKSVIVFLIPLLIFGLLFKTAVRFASQASKWVLFLLLAVCVSNFISTMLSYTVGLFAYQMDLTMNFPSDASALQPMGNISLPKFFENSHVMFASLGLGILGGWLRRPLAEKVAFYLDKVVAVILKGFLSVIPLFVVGFIIKMMDDGVLTLILKDYSLIFSIIAGSVLSYIGIVYFFANKCNKKLFIQSLKNMFPAAITGFGSMSSLAALPLIMLGTEKNVKNPTVARSIVPMTVNIHLIGDCFAIPIFAFAIMKSFGIPDPSFASYALFAMYFVLAKFSVAAVPGGGVLVMLPILESQLGMSGEMLSLITALYILFDPFITAVNILGNGGFSMAFGNFIEEKGSSQTDRQEA